MSRKTDADKLVAKFTAIYAALPDHKRAEADTLAEALLRVQKAGNHRGIAHCLIQLGLRKVPRHTKYSVLLAAAATICTLHRRVEELEGE